MQKQPNLNQCGWYYSEMSSYEAEEILSKCSHGTFILHNGYTNSMKYPYTLSITNHDVVLHISIQIKSSGFYLKTRGDETRQNNIRQNNSPIGFIEMYIISSKSKPDVKPCWVFDCELRGHIFLKRPLHREIQTLQHLCRLQLNRAEPTKLPPGLHIFMKQYTFKHWTSSQTTLKTVLQSNIYHNFCTSTCDNLYEDDWWQLNSYESANIWMSL